MYKRLKTRRSSDPWHAYSENEFGLESGPTCRNGQEVREREKEQSGSKPGRMHTTLGDGMSVLTSSLIRESFLGLIRGARARD